MTTKRLAFMGVSLAVMLTLVSAAVFGEPAQKNSVYRYLSIFTEVFSLIRDHYVDAVPSNQLVDGAFTGITDGIDEYSYYVPPALMAEYRTFVPDEDNGVGIVLTKRYGYAFVISAVEGSPAAEAGIEPGDLIEQIDGQPTRKMSLWQARLAVQGHPGKPLEMKIIHGGMTKRENVSIARTSFTAPAPIVKMYGDIAYIRIPFFEDGTAERFGEALAGIQKSGTKKLIVDVRRNSGGAIDEAIAAADHLLAKGTISTLEGRRIDSRRWDADSSISYDGEVEVLTDSSSAGPAEIFAAAIAGNKRGTTIGTPTFGKAVIQKFVTLPSNGGLNVTVGHYTAPDGKPILDEGVRPEVTVDLSAASIHQDIEQKDRPDVILEKALELFGHEEKTRAAA